MSVQVGDTLTSSGTLHVTDCPTCGCVFAIPDGLYRRGQRYKASCTIYCPNGHPWHYLGLTHAEELAEANRRTKAARDLLAAEERSHTATRGHLTRQRKRAAAGVCPCCHRTFKQLAAHMKSQHPDYPKED